MNIYSPFYVAKSVRFSRVKQLMRWTKMHKKFGAFIEVEEVATPDNHKARKNDLEQYDVKIFCPKLHTDIMGNKAIKR